MFLDERLEWDYACWIMNRRQTCLQLNWIKLYDTQVNPFNATSSDDESKGPGMYWPIDSRLKDNLNFCLKSWRSTRVVNGGSGAVNIYDLIARLVLYVHLFHAARFIDCNWILTVLDRCRCVCVCVCVCVLHQWTWLMKASCYFDLFRMATEAVFDYCNLGKKNNSDSTRALVTRKPTAQCSATSIFHLC